MRRRKVNQRQGFMMSLIVHLVLVMMLASSPPSAPRSLPDITPEDDKRRVVLIPPSVLRQLAPQVRPPAGRPPGARPAPTPPPAPTQKKDRISVGPPVDVRSEGPMILRREDDLTKAPKGRPDGRPGPETPATPPPTPPPQVARAGGPEGGARTPELPGLRVPPGLGPLPRGQEGQRGDSNLARSLRDLDERLRRGGGELGIPDGTGRQMGPLFFDPMGADFTRWINHFKNEVYRNWIVPQPALLGFSGRVEIQFSVERDGTMSSLQQLKSAGMVALDRAAQNALVGSRFLELPPDFGPDRITMRVTFLYNERPG